MGEEKETDQDSQVVNPAELSVEGVDLVEGFNLYRNAYPEILRCYCHDVDEQLALINELTKGDLNEDTLKKYATAVHGIKGSSFGIQADGMGKLAEYMEHTAKAGNAAGIHESHCLFAEKAGNLVLSLKDLLKKLETQAQKEPAKEPDKGLLKKIADACASFSVGKMEEALAELEKYEYESGGDLVAWLREQIDNLEYDSIREKLLTIL